MIQNATVSSQEVEPGDTIRVEFEASERVTFSTSCFVNDPKPPGFRPCAACTTKQMGKKGDFRIVVPDIYRGTSGRYILELKDASGDSRVINLMVSLDRRRPQAVQAYA